MAYKASRYLHRVRVEASVYISKTTYYISVATTEDYKWLKTLPPFSLIRDFREQNTRGNVSKICVNHACYRQIGSKSTNHRPLAWRKKGQKVTLVVVIGVFRSDLSITRMIDANFGNVSAGVLIWKVAFKENGGKCTLLNIWKMFIFPQPTWLLKCTNSYWQFNSNFKSSKCDRQTFPVSWYLPSKDTHKNIHLASSSKINQSLLVYFFFRQTFDRPLSKQKVWREKLLLYFHLKWIAWAV